MIGIPSLFYLGGYKLNPNLTPETNGEINPVLFQNPTVFFTKHILHRTHMEIAVI